MNLILQCNKDSKNEKRTTLQISNILRFLIRGFATAFFSTSALARANDPSNGLCDDYKGEAKAQCIQAHSASNRIEKHKEEGSSLAALRAAERKLEATKIAFFNLTGLPVPGLTLPCEIPEINAWVEKNENRPGEVLPNPTIRYAERGTVRSCIVSYELEPAYAENYGCSTAEEKSIGTTTYKDIFYNPRRNDEGEAVGCNIAVVIGYSPDILQLEACAISLGCDLSE